MRLLPGSRMLRWSLFGLALVGLGFFLSASLSPWPRCTITFSSSFHIDYLSDDGRTLVTLPEQRQNGPYVGPFKVWDIRSGTVVGAHLDNTKLNKWSYSPRGRYLAVEEFSQENLHLIDLVTREHTHLHLKGSNGQIVFSPRESFVFVRGKQHSYLLQTATGKILQTFQASECVGFVPDESLLLHESRNGDAFDLHVWNTQSMQPAKTFVRLRDVALSPDGHAAAALAPDGRVFLDLATFKTRRLGSVCEPVLNALFSPDSRTFAIIGGDGALEFRDVASGKRRKLIPYNQQKPQHFWSVFSPDSKTHCMILDDFLTVRDVPSGNLLWRSQSLGSDAAFTSDLRFLVVPSLNQPEVLNVLAARTGNKSHILDFDMAFGMPGYREMYDLVMIHQETGREPHLLQTLLGNWWPGKSDPKWHRVRLVDVASGNELARLEGNSIEECYHAKDGRTLITVHKGDNQRLLRVWDVPLRPSLPLVVGIPVGLALIVLLITRWRARRRVRVQAAAPATASG